MPQDRDPSTAVVEDVSFSYRRGRPVLDSISVDLDRRSTVLIGPNGAGKSTLLKLLAGLSRPSSGRIIVHGSLGYCPQRIVALPAFRVREQIEYAGWLAGRSRRGSAEAAEWAIELTGLGGLAGRAATALSGGELQRMGIAGALAVGPAMLVLDEPTAALDPVARESVRAVLESLAADGITVVATSHTAGDVGRPFTRLLMMELGRLVYDGDPRDFLSTEHTNATASSFARALRGR